MVMKKFRAQSVSITEACTVAAFHTKPVSGAFSQYIPEGRLHSVERDIQRRRRNNDEERIWKWFVEQNTSIGLTEPEAYRSLGSTRLGNSALKESADTSVKSDGVSSPAEATGKSTYAMLEDKKQLLVRTEYRGQNGSGRSAYCQLRPTDEKHRPDSVEEIPTLLNKSASDSEVIVRRAGYAAQLLGTVDSFEDGEKGRSEKEGRGRGARSGDGALEGAFHRILGMQRNILHALNEIADRISQVPTPDGEQDLQRRQRRSAEFAVRFSRNYLYELNRVVTRIRWKVETEAHRQPKDKHSHDQCSHGCGDEAGQRNPVPDSKGLEQEVLTAHQLLLHGLTVYCNHLPNSLLTKHSLRLAKELLRLVADLAEIAEKCSLPYERLPFSPAEDATIAASTVEEIRCKCQAILTRFDRESAERTVAADPQRKRQEARQRSGDPLRNRLRMYQTREAPRQLVAPLKKATAERRNENGCCIRRRKGRERDPVCANAARPSAADSVSKLRHSNEICSTLHLQAYDWKRRTFGSREQRLIDLVAARPDAIEDSGMKSEIATMIATTTPLIDSAESKGPEGARTAEVEVPVEADTEAEADVEAEESLARRCNDLEHEISACQQTGATLAVTKSRSSGSSTCIDSNITRAQFCSLVPVIAELMSLVCKKERAQNKNPDDIDSMSEISVNTAVTLNAGGKGRRKNSLPANRGRTKFSTKSDAACVPSPLLLAHGQNKSMDLFSSSADKNGVAASARSSRSASTACRRANHETDIRKVTSIEKASFEALNNGDSTTLTLPEKVERSFSEYRRAYREMCRSRPMYSCSTRNKPWDIVSWISDKLVEELLAQVAEELEICTIIRKMFQLEFREF